ncbi:hypothetical protein CEXT_405681 [Caerostris extrusa]|uniref:Uncharacterized protein n=1 Tax=Caerostris extrusa TaxID=172846 RepID=A0AAV4UN11_CAEEX|nr:hypothetical protein CEXT_405681 [Caerostris extrusa]
MAQCRLQPRLPPPLSYVPEFWLSCHDAAIQVEGRLIERKMNSIGTAFLLAIVVSTAVASRSFYTAAVFEHTGLASKNYSTGAKVAKESLFLQKSSRSRRF